MAEHAVKAKADDRHRGAISAAGLGFDLMEQRATHKKTHSVFGRCYKLQRLIVIEAVDWLLFLSRGLHGHVVPKPVKLSIYLDQP